MNRIADLYNANPEFEWNRLIQDAYHRLEFIVFMHHLSDHLPGEGLILDAGGGPGRYTIQLARMGYDLILLDLSEGCIRVAEEKISEEPDHIRQHVKDMTVGDVTDLQRFNDETFDGVLCFDPLSYLPELSKRKKAISELIRVAKPGASIALVVRGYLGALRTVLRVAPHDLVNGSIEHFEKTGNIRSAGVMCHFFRAEELRGFAEDHGLLTRLMAGAEGLSSGLPEATAVLYQEPDKWEKWIDVMISTSAIPAVVDTSEHILYIGEKA